MSRIHELGQLTALLERAPTESLDLEIKEWLNLDLDHGRAKVVKAILALRNNNGGQLIIGFRDSGEQAGECPFGIVRDMYSTDRLNELACRYCHPMFEVRVDFIRIREVEYPVISVPSGIRVPVLCKADMTTGGNRVLKENAIYVRTIQSNRRVSSSEIRREDWPRLLDMCFDNREADIARFVRRNLMDLINPEIVISAARAENANLSKMAMERGFERFSNAMRRPEEGSIPTGVGFCEFGVYVPDVTQGQIATMEWLANLNSNVPRLTGWRPWVFIPGALDRRFRPYTTGDGFECFINEFSSHDAHPVFDFWCIDLVGSMYHLRMLEDDLIHRTHGYEAVTQGSYLDFVLQIRRVTEGIWTALSIASNFVRSNRGGEIEFSVRWRGLRNRLIDTWSDLSIRNYGLSHCHQDIVEHSVSVPFGLPRESLHLFVFPITQRLLAAFGGASYRAEACEAIVSSCFQ